MSSSAGLRARVDDYVRRAWSPIPVRFRSKAPILTDWPHRRLGPADVGQYFNGQPTNIGILLGHPSGGLTDVDLDCSEALRMAPVFLPPTHSRFGRRSSRASHWLYLVTDAIETETFADPDAKADDAMLVELRSTGRQTLFPGSVHPSGEPIEWDEDGEPARGDGASLRRAVAELAAACLLSRHWPPPGQRHAAALAAAGLLVRGGVEDARAMLIVHQAALVAGDDEAPARRRDVVSTVARVLAGEPVTGGPTLAAVLRGDGTKVVAALRRLLGLQGPADAEPPTDVANAARFVAEHGSSFRYCYAWSVWLHYDGRRWRRDAGDAAVRAAKHTSAGWFTAAAQCADRDRRKQLARWAVYANSEPGIRRMLALAQAELAITSAQLDANPHLLNCPNGTVELRTGHLRPHRAADFITKLTAAPYEPDARHPVWDRFLVDAIPEDDARAFAQIYAGYALTGLTTEDVFVIAFGPAGGGKSTFVESLRRTWGDYATSADFSTFLAKKAGDAPREDVARLAGARLVTSVETRDGQRLAEGLVKLLSGGDTVAARRLYEQTFEFRPEFKMLFASNYRPRARADDHGVWRRLRELPFPTARLEGKDRDASIRAVLTDPAIAGAAILRWAIDGAVEWFATGLGEPETVMAASRDYRKSQQPLADFVADRCILHPDRRVAAHLLREAYETWCKATGVRHPLAGRAWGTALRGLGCEEFRTSDERGWKGIDLRGVLEDEPGG